MMSTDCTTVIITTVMLRAGVWLQPATQHAVQGGLGAFQNQTAS